MSQEQEMAEWQKGVPLARLKQITACIDEHDEGLILGAFTAISERTVADWISSGELLGFEQGGEVKAVIACEKVKARRRVVDFSGDVRTTIDPGTEIIKKVACRRGSEPQLRALLSEISPRAWMEGWMEHPLDLEAAITWRSLVPVAVKVRASSELWGVWGPFAPGRPLCRAEDFPTLRQLKLDVYPFLLKPAQDAIAARPPQTADHYSSYNVKHSWSALSLRGYGPVTTGDNAADPSFIIKPSEMAKKWQAENPEKMRWILQDTAARAAYPEFEGLIDAVPGTKHRIRLMNLAPGGGELKRHADITDPDAGAQDGQLMRIHVPIRTNRDVIFTSWNLGGEQLRANMAVGTAWYLDTRKPHRAVNGGQEHRLHLVMDVEANPELRALIAAGQEARL